MLNTKRPMAFHSFAYGVSIKEQVGVQGGGSGGWGKLYEATHSLAYRRPDVSGEDSHNKHTLPEEQRHLLLIFPLRRRSPLLEFRPRGRWLLRLDSWHMCFPAPRRHPDGEPGLGEGVGGRPGQTDKTSTERGTETDRERPANIRERERASKPDSVAPGNLCPYLSLRIL